MKFISRLIDVMVASDAMPLLAVIEGLDLISTAIRTQRLFVSDSIKILVLSLKDAELRTLQSWESTLVQLKGMRDAIVDVEISYEDKPTFETWDVLTRLAERLGGPSPTYIGGRSGSYIEVLKMGIETVLGLAICAGLLVRIIDSMIKIRAKSEILFAPRLPSIVRTTALQSLPSTSTELLNYVALCKTIAADPTSSVTLAMPEFGEKLKGIEVGSMGKSHARARKRGGAGPLALGDRTAED